ncbi:MAG: pyridoxamine 5'-phosphate oxidase [Solirubrobacteraceae bacterium]
MAVNDHSLALREQDLDPDPLRQFERWFAEADAAGVRLPEAVALATASARGAPSLRMVLMKGFDERGLVFFTNYASRKGLELAANPHAALMFYWDPLGRQVRLEGPVARTSARESAEYVRSRPHASQLSALASPQSRPLQSREELELQVAALRDRYGEGELPLPQDWGGFRLDPHSIEFWQQRNDRLHDRLSYLREGGRGWRIERLAP